MTEFLRVLLDGVARAMLAALIVVMALTIGYVAISEWWIP